MTTCQSLKPPGTGSPGNCELVKSRSRLNKKLPAMMAVGCSNSCPSNECTEKLMLEELEWPISLRVRLAHLRKATEIYVGRHEGQRENHRDTTWVRGEFTGAKEKRNALSSAALRGCRKE
jgi:hypothetical protein